MTMTTRPVMLSFPARPKSATEPFTRVLLSRPEAARIPAWPCKVDRERSPSRGPRDSVDGGDERGQDQREREDGQSPSGDQVPSHLQVSAGTVDRRPGRGIERDHDVERGPSEATDAGC